MTRPRSNTSELKRSRKPSGQPTPPWLAWTMGGLGLMLVLACLAIILIRASTSIQGADIQLRLTDTRASQGQWLAEIEARNVGGETAAQVEIEGMIGGENASAIIDYLPASGRGTVVLGFSSDPSEELQLRTRGWTEP